MLNFANQKEATLWHLGIGKILFQFIINYRRDHLLAAEMELQDSRGSELF
jgi:hypothetical protein